MERIRFHHMVFDDEFLTARRDDGSEVRFTRHERTLLQVFAHRPQRLFSRGELMDALGSEASDRAVDFVINRLRAKLDDTGRERRFVATQYGEGYVWVAPAVQPAPRKVFLVIGPVVDGGEAGLAAMGDLAVVLQARTPLRLATRLSPGWRRGAEGAAKPRFSLEVRFRGEDAVLFVREEPVGRVVRTLRRKVGDLATAALATEIVDAAWEAMALGAPGAPAPEDPPIHMRMHEAALALDDGRGRWTANAGPLNRARRRDPEDARFAVMSALQAAAGPILATNPEPLCWATLRPLADEVERLIVGHIDGIREDPMLAISAAKALFLVQRRDDLVEPMVREALESSAAFAAALPVLAQIHAARGDLARADELYNEARALLAPGSEGDLYIVNLQAAARLAAADRPGVEKLFDELVAHRPAARAVEGRLFAAPRRWPGGPHLDAEFAALDRNMAFRMAGYQFFVVARYLADPEHRANAMEGVLDRLVARFGPDVVPDEVWAGLEGRLAHLRHAPVPS
ncbi:helix-turn-helix domain-containing protein [Phenylobacterium sp.]|uniref:winged helix-turn-helix domain-containing protein n=1 Tax=Phenylobacterium sp. TaxID=1871053 RepID=UPI0025DE95F1|nr:helix-turn-helix domain-containing protein [Phenylobacterium sp.]